MQLTMKNGELQIEGIPNLKHVKKIPTPVVLQLVSLSRHFSILEACEQSMQQIRQLTGSTQAHTFDGIIIRFMSCFSSGVEQRLVPEEVFGGNPDAAEAFEYFKDIRDKTIAHDVNLWTQSQVAALLQDGYSPISVTPVVFLAQFTDKATLQYFYELLSHTKDWVTNSMSLERSTVLSRLAKSSVSELSTMEDIAFVLPKLGDQSKRR